MASDFFTPSMNCDGVDSEYVESEILVNIKKKKKTINELFMCCKGM